MVYKLLIEDEFQYRFDKIINYYVYERGEYEYAKKILKLVRKNIYNSIRENPNLYPTVYGTNDVRKLIILDIKYIIYYRVNEYNNTISIFDIRGFKEQKC